MKRQNIRAVHDAVHTTDPDVSILEVSSASVQPEGEAVSSLRLLLHLDSVAQDVPISTVFEGYGYFAAWGIHEKRTNIKPAPFYGSRLPEG